LFINGVTSILFLDPVEKLMLIGSGNGRVALVKRSETTNKVSRAMNKALGVGALKELKFFDVIGSVTSITPPVRKQLLIGTNQSHIYTYNLDTSELKLIKTCHNGAINDVAFPRLCSEIFATCSYEDIRVWNSNNGDELLRITVPNMTCMGIAFAYDGTAIYSIWDDGTIRAFTPQTGRPIFTIPNTHRSGGTAIAVTTDGKRIVSGGKEGHVRVWKLEPAIQTLVESMSEHRGSVTSIHVTQNDEECVTSSTDGSCIIWDLKRYHRLQVLFASSLFMQVKYHPEECQILTTGTDRKIGYWEVIDASLIRELDGSKDDPINTLDISEDGKSFVTGAEDKTVRVWRYSEGDLVAVGRGHSTGVKRVRVSPCQKFIVSVSKDGAIYKWKFPEIHYDIDAH